MRLDMWRAAVLLKRGFAFPALENTKRRGSSVAMQIVLQGALLRVGSTRPCSASFSFSLLPAWRQMRQRQFDMTFSW